METPRIDSTRPNVAGRRILDVGCGTRKTPGAIGMDILPSSAADVVADLNAHWPFEDGSFDEVVANHVLEHVPDVVHVVEEAWRVLRRGGIFVVRGPHFSSGHLVWGDPTHRRGLSLSMFLYFAPSSAHPYAKAQFELKRGALKLSGAQETASPRWWRRLSVPAFRLLESSMNRSTAAQSRAERSWSRFLPCSEVEVELEAVGK